MSSFDVRVFAIRRRPGRKTFEVRWRVAGRDRSRSFMTRALADSYRAELVRTARKGLAFAPETGEPESWAVPEPEPVTWYQHAVAYAEMKWPRLAPHSRASLADALATVTPLLTRETSRRPPAQTLRAALYGHAFNARRRCRAPGPDTASALAWVERASLPVSQLGDPRVIRAVLDGLCTRLDGSPAAANTITRKRAVFHGALGYAVELRLLPANPIGLVRWRAPRAAAAVSPATVASPAQVRAILTQVSRIKPELTAFFGCLYYARCARKKPSPCAGTTSSSRPTAAARLSSPPPARAPAAPGRIPASLMSRPVSSTAPTAPSASSPSRPSWSACSAITSATMAPRRTGGCSAAPAAACSASRSTAAPGTPPARQRSARTWPPPRSPAAPTTCGTPPCRCG